MPETTLFKTFMNLLTVKNIPQPLGVEMVKIIIASKSDNEVKEELISIVQNNSMEEMYIKILPLKKKFDVH